MSPAAPTPLASFAGSPRLRDLGLGEERVALGLAGLGGAWGPVDAGESAETILRALTAGVRAFDAAPAYGNAEKFLGRTLAQWTGSRPVISTKTGRLPGRDALEGRYDYSPAGMRSCVERSLAALGIERVDLLFLHEPEKVPGAERARVVDTLRQLQADGLARRLGLGGGFGAGWDGFVETGAFAAAMIYNRLDACGSAALEADVPRLRRAGLAIYGASPLHMGLLGDRFDEFVRRPGAWMTPGEIERAARLKAVAERHGLKLPALAHRFAFGLAQLDRVVLGSRGLAQFLDAWRAFQAGPLPAEVFAEVVAAGR